MNNKPVIIGGDPILSKSVALTQPQVGRSNEIMRRFRTILKSGSMTKGRYLAEFEKGLGNYLGVDHAVGVSSCTTGLMLALKALGLEGEVIMPSFTFSATAAAVVASGLIPVFVDCDSDTFNIDPSVIASAITTNTSAIMGVHLFGNPAPAPELEQIAARNGLKLLFDAAHGFGSLCNGRPLGSNGHAEVFSCSPTKLLAAGEGGVVTTSRRGVAETVRVGREYGNAGNYDARFPGLNGRMSEFHAAVAIQALTSLEQNAQRRNKLANLYKAGLGHLPGLRFQKIGEGDRASYKDFAVVIDSREFGLDRDAICLSLSYEGVQTRNYCDPPVHRQLAYGHYHPQGKRALPVTDKLAGSILCLPMSSLLTRASVDKICECIRRIHSHRYDLAKCLDVEKRAA